MKFFAEGADGFSVRAMVPVFHAWIQRQAIPGHLLIDVHDYSHIFQGPGILLVGHEANFSLDQTGGQLGLLYHRKVTETGDFGAHLAGIFKAALLGCSLLEGETSLRFRTDEAQLIFNDRLNAPNDTETRARLEPLVAEALKGVWSTDVKMESSAASDSRERLAFRIRFPKSEPIATLLARLG
ncbi:MAG TPA: hypothetical protein VFY29_13360 [Terriglobia bacterium]|nr:hypothetical protein [Terriglobia bacterium]